MQYNENHFVYKLVHEVERRKALCHYCQTRACDACAMSAGAFINSLEGYKQQELRVFQQLSVLACIDRKVAGIYK